MSIFVCGTDTDVGKTVYSAALMARYSSIADVRYWKPVQTGADDDDRANVLQLSGLEPERFESTSLHFSQPLSPHRAAELDDSRIEPKQILTQLARLRERGPLIVEGAGGLLVPLTRNYTWLDFLKESGLPIAVVARSGLGTINHSLLTLETLRRHNLIVRGIAFLGPSLPDNSRTVSEFSGVPVLASFDLPDPARTKPWSPPDPDPAGLLKPDLTRA
ncbi:MAG: dethiobiotin synthase [Spirochaetales bacterium]|nr:dethiobiotin synthase [Spirochaetales bacterium]MCP5485102.1 dethiobiotin synthase [Spirochaetales bacterium]